MGAVAEMKTITSYISQLQDPRKEAILAFHDKHVHLMERAYGSKNNHQTWEGGYLDHISECARIAEAMYSALTFIRPLGFELDLVIIVLYFHDIEKVWKYTSGEDIDKERYYSIELPRHGIQFSYEELNALKYVHGEGEAYSSQNRVMNELAAFCHAVDTISARVWYNEGRRR